jgi:hypothetical protein
MLNARKKLLTMLLNEPRIYRRNDMSFVDENKYDSNKHDYFEVGNGSRHTLKKST